MTDRIDELTRQHKEALERLELQEAAARRSKWTVIASLIAALGAGGGGSVAYFTDGADDETMQTVIAAHIAVSNHRSEYVEAELQELRSKVGAISDAVIRLQVTMEGITDTRRDSDLIKGKLSEVQKLLENAKAPRKPRAESGPEPDAIMQLRQELFDR